MAITKYGDINQRTAAYAAAEALSHIQPVIVLPRYATAKQIPRNTANQVKFRRAVPFIISTIPVVEGVTPASQKIVYEDVPVTLDQYIGVNELTDVVMDTSEDPVLKDMMQLAGEQAAETIELVIWGVARAGTNVFFGAAADTSRSDVNDAISLPRQRAITRFLKAQRAKVITEMQSSSIKFGTEAIAAAFIAIGHTNLENDIRDLPGFTAVERYGSMQPLPFEVGRIEDVRYILSPALTVFASAGSASLNGMVTTNGTNVDVYPIIYLGREALGTVALKGSEAITPMVLNPNQPRGGDPAGQRGTVSWKILYAAVILNQSWMARLEVGATDIGAPQ